jgi:hypothetical protein
MKKQNEDFIGENEMMALFVDLTNSKFWPMIQQYVAGRISYIDTTLRSLDPFKNPTETARTQGWYLGLKDLLDAAELAIAKMKKAEEAEEQKNSKK